MFIRSPATLARLRTTSGRALCSLVTSVFTLTYAAGALAAPAKSRPPRLAIVSFAALHDRVDAETGARLAKKLAGELKDSRSLELVSLDPPARPALPARDPAAIEGAKARVAKAEEHVRKLRFKEAAADLDQAIEQLEGQHPYIAFSDLVSAKVLLAVARFRLGQDTEGERLLAQALRFNPKLQLDGASYPPVFLRVFERIAKQVKAEPQAALFVDGSAAGAELFVDGASRGKAPLALTDLPRGPHFLRLVPAGGEVWARKVELDPASPLKLSPGLAAPKVAPGELAALLQRNTIDRALLDKVAAAAAGADLVLLAGVHRPGKQSLAVSSFLVSLPAGTLCPLGRVSGEDPTGEGAVRPLKAELLRKVVSCPEAASLPATLASDLSAEHAVAKKGGKSDARKPGVDPDLVPLVGPQAAPPPLAAQAALPLPATPAVAPAAAQPEAKAETIGSPVWLWTLVGVAIVGAGAAGGYLLYDAVTGQATGTGTVRW